MSAVLPDPSLTPVFRLEATVGEPLDLGDLPQGRRRIVPLTGGSSPGPSSAGHCFRARAATGRPSSPTAPRSATSATHQTNDGDPLHIQSRGVRHGSEYTFRTSTQIETAAPALDWLNKGVFISVGARQPAP